MVKSDLSASFICFSTFNVHVYFNIVKVSDLFLKVKRKDFSTSNTGKCFQKLATGDGGKGNEVENRFSMHKVVESSKVLNVKTS